jgi:hypothetical protein
MPQLVYKTHYSLVTYSNAEEEVLAEVHRSAGKNSPEYKRLKLLSKELPATLRGSGLRRATSSMAATYLARFEKYNKELRKLKTLQVLVAPA